MPEPAAPDARFLHPEGLAAATLAITCILFLFSIITVALRTYVRLSDRCFGLDDGLMFGGLWLFLADCGVVAYDCFVGLGTRDRYLNDFMSSEGIKYVILWQVFYVTSLCCIKAAICVTLLRIAIEKWHRVAVYGVIVMTVITSIVGFVGVLTVCQPVAANWDMSLRPTAKCASPDVITNLSYLVSASSIITDWACAILPIFILWKTQMNTRTKISVGAVLTLGAVASVSTIVRMPYLRFYKDPNDYLYNIAHVITWSIIECGIGLIAGSLPMLRRLFKRTRGRDTTATPAASAHPSLVTFGGSAVKGRSVTGSSRRFHNPTDVGVSMATVRTSNRHSSDWQKLDDNSGKDAHFIMEQTDVTVDYEMRELARSRSDNSSTEKLRH